LAVILFLSPLLLFNSELICLFVYHVCLPCQASRDLGIIIDLGESHFFLCFCPQPIILASGKVGEDCQRDRNTEQQGPQPTH
jgi:hypothetical protein